MVDKLVEECDENIAEVKIHDKNEDKCNSCILYIALFSIFVAINLGIGAYFVYFHGYLKKMFTRKTTIY